MSEIQTKKPPENLPSTDIDPLKFSIVKKKA